MAGNVQISVKDEQSAKQWLSMVQKINEDYFTFKTTFLIGS